MDNGKVGYLEGPQQSKPAVLTPFCRSTTEKNKGPTKVITLT